MQNLWDSLRQIQKGSSFVFEYAQNFETLFDQLAAVGQPMEETDKSHWFLYGLGPSYDKLSTSQRVVKL